MEFFAIDKRILIGRHGPTDGDGQFNEGDVRILRFELLAVVAGRLKGSFRWRLVLTAGQLTVHS